MPRKERDLNGEDIDYALSALDGEFAKSTLLMSLAPIRFVTSGGTLAVKYFRVRETTKDVDCLTDPNIDAAEDYRKEIISAIKRTAKALDLADNWFNDELKGFIRSEKRMDLFLEAVEQDVVIFQGANLVVYAARMDWQLERKLRRIAAGTNKRREARDISDAVALVKHVRGGGPPLTEEYLESLNFNGWEVSMSLGIDKVRKEYIRTYGETGIAE
ncbi:hypothetical protein EKO27_g7235 [Xylaria grammica]|uniref:Uncharacterized protein n=1 Tax=Xylaria grammica TaxID=363999 RepID=A0A439D092_9PEZI|nr:hypothetical protein EKO27_g7235 [Xylaria grammica]